MFQSELAMYLCLMFKPFVLLFIIHIFTKFGVFILLFCKPDRAWFSQATSGSAQCIDVLLLTLPKSPDLTVSLVTSGSAQCKHFFFLHDMAKFSQQFPIILPFRIRFNVWRIA
eukprot:1073970_1